ncbi:MAG: cytochrome-c peroxidase [Gammaproteobacteria bacterium]
MSKASQGFIFFLVIIAIIIAGYWIHNQTKPLRAWSEQEIKLIQSLWINNLPPVPIDSSNAVADELLAAEFGYKLFFDTRLSASGKISCSTCHQPENNFTDGLKVAEGHKTGFRNSMSLVGTVYSPWFFWDGRKDSLWSQALGPLETAHEHAGSRMQYARLIAEDKNYRSLYTKLFGSLPDFSDSVRFPQAAGPVENQQWNDAWQSMSAENQQTVNKVFVNIGKSIAAYERLLLPGPSRFDMYAEGIVNNDSDKLEVLNFDEIAGLKLFVGKAQCTNCHNGPLFTNNEFHNTSILSSSGKLPSMGRVEGAQTVLDDPFNCLGSFNDALTKQCDELQFIKTGDELIGAHKTPSLRNVADTAPYMHSGQLSSLAEVIDQYNRAPDAMIGHNEAKPLGLNKMEIQQLTAFLHSLSAPLATDAKWLKTPDN